MGKSISFDVAALDKASETLSDVGREVAQLDRKISDAGGNIPIDVDGAKARSEIAAIEAQLGRLNAKAIKLEADKTAIDRDLAALNAELKRTTDEDHQVKIKGDIADLQAKLRTIAAQKVSIDLETAAAMAKARQVEAAVDGVRDKRARIDVDVSDALAGVGRLIALMAAVPAATSVAVGAIGAVAGAGAVASVGMGAAALGFKDVGEALTAMGEKATGGGSKVSTSASEIRSATQGVVQARRDLERANEDVKLAEADLTLAQEDARRVQEDLTHAHEEAARALQDLETRSANMALDQESAALSVAEAEQRLADLRKDGEADALDIARAELSIREARQRQNDLTIEATRLAQDKAEADAKGVDGSDQVVAATDRAADAQRRVEDADRRVRDSKQNVIEATERLTESQIRLQEAMQPKGGGGGGVDKQAEALAKLGPKARAATEDLSKFIDGPLKAFRQAGQEEYLPRIVAGLEATAPTLKKITPEYQAYNKQLGDIGASAIKLGADLAGPFLRFASASLEGLRPFGTQLQETGREIGAVLDRLTQSGQAEQAMRSIGGALAQLLPLLPQLVQSGTEAAIALGPGLSAILGSLSSSAGSSLPNLVSLAGTFSDLLVAVAPVAPELAVVGGALAALNKVGLLSPILSGVGAGFKALAAPAQSTGRHVADTSSKLSGLTSVLGAGGPWGIAIATATTVLGNWAMKHAEAKARVEGLTDAIQRDNNMLGENTRLKVVNTLESSGALAAARSLGLNLATVTNAAMGNTTAQRAMNDELARLKTVMLENGIQAEDVRAAKNIKDLQAALASSNSEIDKAVAANQRQRDAMASTQQAATSYQQALDAAKNAVITNGVTLDGHTAKGQANKAALDQLKASATAYMLAVQAQLGPGAAFDAKLSATRTQLISTATQLGMTQSQAKTFADQVLAIPTSHQTTITANTSSAIAALQSVQRTITTINDKTVTITVRQQDVTISSGGTSIRAQARGGPVPMVPGARRGVDSVPTLLMPEEYVIKASQAAAWRPVLDAINAGASPASVAASIPGGGRGSGSGGAGGGLTVIVQTGAVLADEAGIATAVVSGLQTAVSRGMLPASLMPAAS